VFVGVFGLISTANAAALPAPTSPSPRDGATAEHPVTLKWSKATFPGGVAGGYVLEAAGSKLPSGWKAWTQTNSYTFTETLLIGTKYRWRVRTCFGFGAPVGAQAEEDQCGPWSNNGNTWEFTPTLAKPKLLLPADTLRTAVPINADGSVTLQWEKVVGADRYNVVLNKTSGITFTHTFGFPEIPPNATFFSIPFQWIQLNDSYTWQVIPLQGNKPGPASDLWEFFVALAKPDVANPAPGAVIPVIPPSDRADIPLRWTSVAKAEVYLIEVFKDGKTIPRLRLEKSDLSAEVRLEVGIYEWKVTACKTGLVNCGPTGGPWKFTVVSDDIPPRVVSFDVSPKAPAWASDEVKISWRVSDEQGGSKLKEVQVYRVPYKETGCNVEDISRCGTWPRITEVQAPPDSRDWSCKDDVDDCPTDSPEEGVYLYGIHVLDNAKNEITETEAGKKRIKVQVDKTDPIIVTFEADPTQVTVENRSLKISYSVFDVLSGLKTVELWQREQGDTSWGNDPYKTQTISGGNLTKPRKGTFTETFGLGIEKIYEYRLRVVDQAGNTCDGSVEDCNISNRILTVEVDTKAPVMTCNITVDVDYNNVTQQGVPVTLSAPSEISADVAEEYIWEFGDGESQTTFQGFALHTYKPPQRYTAKLHLKDDAGNTSRTCTVTVDIDDDEPRIDAFRVEPDVPDWVNVQNLDAFVAWEVTDSGGSNLDRVEVWRAFDSNGDDILQETEWGNAALETFATGNVDEHVDSFFHSFISQPGGTYWYGLHVFDRAGNRRDESRPIKVQVDTELPQCGFGFSVFRRTNPLKVGFVPVLESLEKGAKYTWTFGDGTPEITGNGRGIDHTYGAAGTYTVTLEVQDKAGNVTPPCEKVVLVAAPPPPPGVGTTCGPTVPCAGDLVCNRDTSKCEERIRTITPGAFENPLKAKNFADVLNTVLNFLFTMALVIAPLTILAAAFMFVTGGGNPEQVSRAKKTLVWTIVGFLVILASKGIVFVIQDILGVSSP